MKLFKQILFLTSVFFFLGFNLNAEENPCFQADTLFKSKLIKATFDSPRGEIKINYPTEVAFGSEYTLSGKWGLTYDYTKGSYIVTAGWVNDESDSSVNFWKTGYYDKQILNERELQNSRTFNCKLKIPKDDTSKTHKVLKLQVTITATGDNTQFYQSYVYRIPVSKTIQGSAQSIDVDLKTGEYIKTPLFGTKAKAVLLQNALVYESNDLIQPNCYKLAPDTAQGPFDLRIYDMGGDGEELYTRTIENVPNAGKFVTWMPRGIQNQLIKEQKRLNNVNVTASYIFGNLEFKLPITYTYFLQDVQNTLSDFRKFSGPYDSLQNGSQTDSLRADYLTRVLIAEIATDSIYKQAVRLTGETGKSLTALAATFLFKDELDFIAGTADNSLYTKEVAKSISFMIAQAVAQIYDWTISTSSLSKDAKTNLNTLYKLISSNVNGQFASQGKGYLSLWKTLIDNTFESTVVLGATQVFMPNYVYWTEGNFNSFIKSHADKNYYPYTDIVKQNNLYAYNKTINMDENATSKSRLTKFTEQTTDNINTSIGFRKAFGILTALEKCKDLAATGPLLGKLFASKILKIINIAPLAMALYLDGTALLEVPNEQDYCVQKAFNPDLGYFHREKKIMKQSAELYAKRTEIIDDLNSKYNDFDIRYKAKLDELINISKTNDKNQIGAKLIELIRLNDTSFALNRLVGDYIGSIADTIKRKDSAFYQKYAYYLDKRFQTEMDKQSVFEEALKIIEGMNGASIDSLTSQVNIVKTSLSEFKDSNAYVINQISAYPLSPFISIKDLTKVDTLVKPNQSAKIKFNLENLSTFDCDSVIISLDLDSFAIAQQPLEIKFDKFLSHDFKNLEWDVTVSDTTKYILSYKINVSSINTLPKAYAGMYRLDGKESPLGVNDNPKIIDNSVKINSITPNPAGGDFNVQIKVDKFENIKLTICDVLGNQAGIIADGFYNEGVYNFKFSASNLNSGVYFIKLENGTNNKVEKLIINK